MKNHRIKQIHYILFVALSAVVQLFCYLSLGERIDHVHLHEKKLFKTGGSLGLFLKSVFCDWRVDALLGLVALLWFVGLFLLFRGIQTDRTIWVLLIVFILDILLFVGLFIHTIIG